MHLCRSHGDCWGATDLSTLSLHLILFSYSLRAWQNFNPVHSEKLLSQRFFCRPLLPCKFVLASPADLDTQITYTLMSSQGPMTNHTDRSFTLRFKLYQPPFGAVWAIRKVEVVTVVMGAFGAILGMFLGPTLERKKRIPVSCVAFQKASKRTFNKQ